MRSPPQFEIHEEINAGRARLTPVGELDMASVPELERAARRLLSQDANELIIDLSRVPFMDSSGLRLLISLHDEACEEGWTLGLLRPSAGPAALFHLTGLDEHLPLIEQPVA